MIWIFHQILFVSKINNPNFEYGSVIGDVQTSRGVGHVHYNERFHWNKVDEMEQEYEKARERGLPQPILYIAEYFGADAGGLRWTRGFRQAGHFVYITLWYEQIKTLDSDIHIWYCEGIFFGVVAIKKNYEYVFISLKATVPLLFF